MKRVTIIGGDVGKVKMILGIFSPNL